MNKTQIPNRQQQIFELCQTINFGRVTFAVRDGGLDPSRPWRTVQTVKLAGGENGARPEAGIADFALRVEHTALLTQLAMVPNGTRVTVEVKHGVPFLLEIDQESVTQ